MIRFFWQWLWFSYHSCRVKWYRRGMVVHECYRDEHWDKWNQAAVKLGASSRPSPSSGSAK